MALYSSQHLITTPLLAQWHRVPSSCQWPVPSPRSQTPIFPTLKDSKLLLSFYCAPGPGLDTVDITNTWPLPSSMN